MNLRCVTKCIIYNKYCNIVNFDFMVALIQVERGRYIIVTYCQAALFFVVVIVWSEKAFGNCLDWKSCKSEWIKSFIGSLVQPILFSQTHTLSFVSIVRCSNRWLTVWVWDLWFLSSSLDQELWRFSLMGIHCTLLRLVTIIRSTFWSLYVCTNAESLHCKSLNRNGSNRLSFFLQTQNDLRHSLLQEQPALQAAISSWHRDSELQEILRKGQLHLTINKL